MNYLGDFKAASSVNFKFTTHASTGGSVAPSSAFEAADLIVYKGSSATQRSSASGITMTSPFDSITGLHHVTIDLSDNTDAGFWAAGNDYSVVLSPDETVDSQTVVAEVATFSIENRVVNWAQVVSPTTTLNLSGTTVLLSSGTGTGQILLSSGKVVTPDDQKVDVNTVKTQAVVCAAGVTVGPFVGQATAAIAVDGSGHVTAGTVSDKTGYSISGTTTTLDALQTALNSAHGAGSWATATGFSTHSAADVWSVVTRTLTAGTNIQLPSNGLANVSAWTVDITGSLSGNVGGISGITFPSGFNTLTVAAIADGVWDEATSGHATSGTTGAAIVAAGSAGDPWSTSLPGAYGSGTAGKIVGDNLNATVSSRAVAGDAMALTSSERTSLAAVIWNSLTSGMSTVGSIGKRIVDYLTGDVYARLGSPAGASAAADIAAIKTDTAAILLDTDSLDTTKITTARAEVLSDWINGGRLDLILDTIATDTTTDIPALIDALPTASENAAVLLDLSDGVEAGIALRQALRLILAAAAGKLSGAATTEIVIRNVGDSKDRITATVDADGNRSAVTVDVT